MIDDGDRGSASIWVLGGAALVSVIAFAAVGRGDATLARHRAEFAADAAALAGAGQIGLTDEPCAAAATIARANSTKLSECTLTLSSNGLSGQISISVEASVSLPMVGTTTVRAQARAERSPG